MLLPVFILVKNLNYSRRARNFLFYVRICIYIIRRKVSKCLCYLNQGKKKRNKETSILFYQSSITKVTDNFKQGLFFTYTEIKVFTLREISVVVMRTALPLKASNLPLAHPDKSSGVICCSESHSTSANTTFCQYKIVLMRLLVFS